MTRGNIDSRLQGGWSDRAAKPYPVLSFRSLQRLGHWGEKAGAILAGHCLPLHPCKCPNRVAAHYMDLSRYCIPRPFRLRRGGLVQETKVFCRTMRTQLRWEFPDGPDLHPPASMRN